MVNEGERRLRPLTKYLVIQIPGWILAVVVLAVLSRWIDLPLWAAVGLFFLGAGPGSAPAGRAAGGPRHAARHALTVSGAPGTKGRGAMEREEPIDPFAGEELELSFPCSWSYTVIGEDEGEVHAAIASAVQGLEHSITFSHESKGGKYRSYQLEVLVPTNAERLRVYRELHASTHVRYLF